PQCLQCIYLCSVALLRASPVATLLMPCYVCQLEQFRSRIPIPLSNTNNVASHGKILKQSFIPALLWLALAQSASPQLSRTPDLPAPPPPPDSATVERPDFAVTVPRIN